MTKTIKVALAGAGAFGIKHLDGIKNIDGVEVVSLVGRELEQTKEVAAKYGIAHVTTDLADSLALKEVDAVILCTPTQMHAAQAIACLKAGKHVQVEIPLAIRWPTRRRSSTLQKQTGLVAMCGHTRRFNPSHQWVHKKIVAGELQHPADGRADLLLPPHEHERAGPAAQLDRPSAVAPRRAHRGPVRLPGALADREGQRGPGSDPPDARDRDGHVASSSRPPTARSARSACPSTTTGRSAPSSATSATPAPTSPATTTSSTARKRRSTSPRSTCR